MIGYKGFDKNFRCRDKQYAVGETYHYDGGLKICECGFHFCKSSLAVFEFYPPTSSRFALVEATGKILSNGIHKFCTNEITIIKELSLSELIREASKSVGDCSAATNSGDCSVAVNSGDYSAATNSGDYSAAVNSGYCSAATNSGDCSVAVNSGDYSAATNSGDCSVAVNSGDCSVAVNSGDCSVAVNSGDYSAAVNSGYYSAAVNSGYCSGAIVSGADSIAVVSGKKGKAKGNLGCWLVLSEWTNNKPTDVQLFKVDGDRIKPDTFYMLKNGSPVEVHEDD